jgi:hypothetical protein
MKRFIATLRDRDSGEEMTYKFLEADIQAARDRAQRLADEAKMDFISIVETPEEGDVDE